MSERQTIEPETDGVLTVTIDGIDSQFRVSAGAEVEIEWSDGNE